MAARKTKSGDELVIRVRVDDETFTLNVDELGYKDEMRLYRESKLTMTEIIGAFANGTLAPFMTAAVVFLAKCQAGDNRVTFDDVADGFGQFTPVEWFPNEPEPEAPKAPE